MRPINSFMYLQPNSSSSGLNADRQCRHTSRHFLFPRQGMGNTYINAINTGNSWWPRWTWGAWWTRGTSLTRSKKKEQLEPGKSLSQSGGPAQLEAMGLSGGHSCDKELHPHPLCITGLISYFGCHYEDWQHCPHRGNGEGVKPPALGPATLQCPQCWQGQVGSTPRPAGSECRMAMTGRQK